MKHNAVIRDYYFIEKLLGSGSFGEVYLAREKTEDEKIIGSKLEDLPLVAIKVENKKKTNKLLIKEYKIYKYLQRKNIPNVPKVFNFIKTEQYNIMEMELLDNNIDTMYNTNKFDLKTVLYLGIEITKIIQNIHNVGLLHRDIKPSNFMLKDKKVYVMDFGLAKRFKFDGVHIKYESGKSLIGTARYASVNVHDGHEPSRRDDLISICYMLIFFLKGSLPWQGLPKQDNFLQKIGKIKSKTNVDKLCEDIPECFKLYLIYCQGLCFEERPDYLYLINLFVQYCSINSINFDNIFSC